MPNKIFPLGNEGTSDYKSHIMEYSDAMNLVSDFQKTGLGNTNLVSMGRLFTRISWHGKAIKELMAQKGAAALGAYLGRNQNRDTIVLVAVDKDGYDIQGIALDWGEPCPPHCYPPPHP